jgi:hypothetical protein
MACDQSYQPGGFNPNVAWSQYRQFLKVERPPARSLDVVDAIQNNWSARELERQINSPTANGRLQLGSPTLGGTLSATVSGSFAPAVGDQFEVVGSGGLSGTFTNVNLPAGIVVSYTNLRQHPKQRKHRDNLSSRAPSKNRPAAPLHKPRSCSH